jgi:tetratricopeptide (TPR) repeat protein
MSSCENRATPLRTNLCRLTLVAALAGALGLPVPPEVAAGIRTPMGKLVPNAKLRAHGGGAADLLKAKRAALLLFVRPEQPHTLQSMPALLAAIPRLPAKLLRIVVVVPGATLPADLERLVATPGFALPVLVDDGDVVHQRLGVMVHPLAAVVDARHLLVGWQTYTRVNYAARVEARTLHAVGAIDDAELERRLAPPPPVTGGDAAAARSHARLAAMLARAKSWAKAEAAARRALELDPRSADAHAVLGAVGAAAGDCARAEESYRAALEIAPEHEAATAGLEKCRSAEQNDSSED